MLDFTSISSLHNMFNEYYIYYIKGVKLEYHNHQRIYINIYFSINPSGIFQILSHNWTGISCFSVIWQEIGARLCTISCLDYDLNKVSVTLHLTSTLLLLLLLVRSLSSVTSEWLIGVCPSNNVANCLSPWIHVYSSVSNPLGLGDTRCRRRERERERNVDISRW